MTTVITTTTISATATVASPVAAPAFPYITFYANGKRCRVQLFIGFDLGRDRAEAIVASIQSKYPTAELAKWNDGSKVFTERYWNSTTKQLVRSDRKGFILNIPMQDMVVPSESKPGYRKLDVLQAWVNATQLPRLTAELESTLATLPTEPSEDAIAVTAEIVGDDSPEPTKLATDDRRTQLQAWNWSQLAQKARALGLKTVKGTKKPALIEFILENEF